MFKGFFKKERRVVRLIYEYLETVLKCRENFLSGLDSCLLNGVICEDFEFFLKQTHKCESRADDIHDEINDLMYGKALIPDARGDIMELLEAIDGVPDLFDHILHMIYIQKITVPGFLLLDLRDLVRISMECCDQMTEQTQALLKKQTGIRAMLDAIDTNESHCDHIERRLITKLFESDLDPFLKLQIKDLIELIGDISDQAYSVSKKINIISMKRRV
jgi:predicted phosphate transport protein (TIGR00153 family)